MRFAARVRLSKLASKGARDLPSLRPGAGEECGHVTKRALKNYSSLAAPPKRLCLFKKTEGAVGEFLYHDV